jgi:hypothetical protein
MDSEIDIFDNILTDIAQIKYSDTVINIFIYENSCVINKYIVPIIIKTPVSIIMRINWSNDNNSLLIVYVLYTLDI